MPLRCLIKDHCESLWVGGGHLFPESSTQYISLPPVGAKGNAAIWLLLALFLHQGLESKAWCGREGGLQGLLKACLHHLYSA